MKHKMKTATCLLLTLLLLFYTVSCAPKVKQTGLWESATYLGDTTLGDGANTVEVELSAEEQTITFTIKTDKTTLGDALFEHGLTNDPTFFDTCNGIRADWDADGAYWAFYIDGTLATIGIGDAAVPSEQSYRIVYTTW